MPTRRTPPPDHRHPPSSPPTRRAGAQPHDPSPPTVHPTAASARPATPTTGKDRAGAPTPVSVWPVGPLRACATPGCATSPGAAPCAGQLPDRLWYRMVAAFSRPGDLVLVADAGTGAAVAACADFDRRVIAHVATRDARNRVRARALAAGHDTPARALFGDSPRTRTGRLAVTWPARTHRRPASLLIVPSPCTTSSHPHHEAPARPGAEPACPGRPTDGPAHRVSDPLDLTDDAWQRQVIADAVHLLHPGALIVAITAGTHPAPGTGAFDDPAGRIINAAHEAGLSYLQHIVAVHADLSDGRLTLPDALTTSAPTAPSAPTDRPASTRTAADGAAAAGSGPRHRRAHLDLIVLTVPGGTHDA
jgi:hypothetical protein